MKEKNVNPAQVLTPTLAFVLCLLLTLGASFFAYHAADMENRGRFDRAVTTFSNTLRSRMIVYTNSINYTRNLFHLKPNLTEAEFHQFITEMNLAQDFPGIQTIGFVNRMGRAEALSTLKKMKVTPEYAGIGDSDEIDLVRFVEKINEEVSSTSLGINLGQSLERKQAMNMAMETGTAVATNSVAPMAKVLPNGKSTNAFLVFVPLYKRDMPISTVEERKKAIEGFIYGGFRATTLFGQISSEIRFRDVKFQIDIFDGRQMQPQNLLFSEGNVKDDDVYLSKESELEFDSHIWSIRVAAPKAFMIPSLRWAPYFVFTLGLLLSIAVTVAFRKNQKLALRLHEDILIRKKAESQLEEARKDADHANRAKSIFLANISHEIRTPLGVIIGYGEMALMQKTSEEREKSLHTIIRNGKELTRIIGDVLDVSKIEANALKIEKSKFSLQKTLQDISNVWRPMVAAKGLQFEMIISDRIPAQINADETRIKQVLVNLISNALKFTAKGSVKIQVEPIENLNLKFTVSDSGIGISKSNINKLFKPFSQGDSSITRKFGGNGLGLALSKEIASFMGGTLDLARSEEGEGSVFTFTVPFEGVSEVSEPVITDKKSDNELFGKKILVVDDAEDNRDLVTLFLNRVSAKVDVASDGEEAVQKAMMTNYDLILMDIQMPRKDGYTALKELKEKKMMAPIVALTAHALKEERDKALLAGFSAYLTKPLDYQTLISVSAEQIKAGASV